MQAKCLVTKVARLPNLTVKESPPAKNVLGQFSPNVPLPDPIPNWKFTFIAVSVSLGVRHVLCLSRWRRQTATLLQVGEFWEVSQIGSSATSLSQTLWGHGRGSPPEPYGINTCKRLDMNSWHNFQECTKGPENPWFNETLSGQLTVHKTVRLEDREEIPMLGCPVQTVHLEDREEIPMLGCPVQTVRLEDREEIPMLGYPVLFSNIQTAFGILHQERPLTNKRMKCQWTRSPSNAFEFSDLNKPRQTEMARTLCRQNKFLQCSAQAAS